MTDQLVDPSRCVFVDFVDRTKIMALRLPFVYFQKYPFHIMQAKRVLNIVVSTDILVSIDELGGVPDDKSESVNILATGVSDCSVSSVVSLSSRSVVLNVKSSSCRNMPPAKASPNRAVVGSSLGLSVTEVGPEVG